MPNLQLSQKFQDKIRSVVSHAKATEKGLLNSEQVVWDTLADKGPDEPGYDRFFWTARDEFKRDDLATDYGVLWKTPAVNSEEVQGRHSQVWLVRLQHDWLMQGERDFLMRRHTRIRTEAHAAAIKRGISHDDGPILAGGIDRHVKNVLELASRGSA